MECKKTSCVHGLEEVMLLKCPTTQRNLQVKCNLFTNSSGVFIKTGEKWQN